LYGYARRVPLFRRSDGDLVRDLPPVRRIMPHIMRGRNESIDENGSIDARDGVEACWTFDERINDGFYCAASLEIVRAIVEDPASRIT
jgi:hypothetical protein